MGVEGIGARVARKEDKRFLTGKGRYTDDMTAPGMKYAYFVRSPHAHARIVKIDTAEATKAPGVVAVFTWDDMAKEGCGYLAFPAMFPNADGAKPDLTPRRPLAHEAVRYVGEAVVAVVALTVALLGGLGFRWDPLNLQTRRLEAAEARQPMGMLVKPDNVAGLASYLLSEASGVMTGALIDFDQNVAGAYPE